MRSAHHALRCSTSALLAALLALASCRSEKSGDGGADAATDAGDDAIGLSAAELATLATLSPEPLPAPPADISNRYADDPAAAALGQRLFFETAFSGALLEGDDDGSATTLGVKGQTGKVACAGCHIPSAGYLDNRSLGEQIARRRLGTQAHALAARRGPGEALDVGRSPRRAL